jgi:uncharacterized protein YegJ (DUF2314 family)
MRLINVLIGTALLSAATPSVGQAIFKDGKPDVVGVAATDPAMERAKAEGRKTLPQFLARWARPARDETDFMVKFDLTPQADAEFIWAADIRRENGDLTGTLLDTPIAPQFREGQRVAIPENLIIDWAYFKGSVMQGNVTTRVLLDRLPAEDAAMIRKSYGW